MSVSIELGDFAGDVIDVVEPVMRAIGLIDENNNFNLDDWSFNKATQFMDTPERTEMILNLLSGLLDVPSSHHRLLKTEITGGFKASGILLDSSTGDTLEEEWFKVLDIASWDDGSVSGNLIFDHDETTGQVDGTTSDHSLSIGVGLELNQTINGNTINGLLSIPLIRLGWDPTHNNGPGKPLGTTLFESLIWADESGLTDEEKSRSRISLSISIEPVGGGYYETPTVQYPRFTGASIGTAFGNGGGIFALTLEGFQSQDSAIPEDMVIDSWDAAGSAVNSILEGAFQSALEKLAGSPKIAQNLLPMLGLSKSSHPDLGTNWPTFNVIGMITDIVADTSNGHNVLLSHLKDWFDELINLQGGGTSGIAVWVEHLLNLLDDSWASMNWGTQRVTGHGTLVSPWLVDLASFFSISSSAGYPFNLDLKCALWDDTNGVPNIDLGCIAGVSHDFGALSMAGALDTWFMSISLPSASAISLTLVPEIDAVIDLTRSGTDLIEQETANIDGTLVSIKVGSLRAGLGLNRSRDFVPILELHDVEFGTSDWAVLDLTSADTPAEILQAGIDTVTDIIQAILSDGGVLQWFSSLLGICSPRGEEVSAFATAWDAQGLSIDLMKFISAPVEAIGEYYQNLTTNTFTIPTTSITRPALAFVFEAGCNLIRLGFSELLGSTPVTSISDTDDLTLDVTGNTYTAIVVQISDDVRFELACEIDPSPDGSIGLGLNIVLAEIPFDADLTLAATIQSDIIDITFTQSSIGIDVDASLLQRVALELSVSRDEGERIQLIPLGSLAIGFLNANAHISWRRGIGMNWGFEIVEPGVQGFYPNISGIIDEPDHLLTDGVTNCNCSLKSIHEKLKSFYWDGTTITEENGETHIPQDTDPITVEIDSDHNFELIIEEDTISFSSIGYGSNGFSIDFSGISLADFGGVLSQMLAYKGGRLGMFTAVFFRLHPDVVHINLGVHATKNQYLIPDWYSCPATGNWPAEWRQLHRSNPDHFGFGPLSIPMDWPGINLNTLQNDPMTAIQDHLGQVMSGTSASGELYAFSAMRWIWALLNGRVPSLNQPDLGWGAVADSDFMGSHILDVPEIPLRFKGAGSYEDPWRIPLLETNAGNVEFIMWVGPDGPPMSQMAYFASSPDSPSLEELLESNSAPDDLHGTNSTDIENLVDTLYDMSQFSPRVRAAIAGRIRNQLKMSMIALNDFWNESDGLVSLNVQSNVSEWTGSTPTVSETMIGSYRDALSSEAIIAEVLEYHAQIKISNPTTRVLLIHPPWQSPLDWENLIMAASDAGASIPLPPTGSIEERVFIGDSSPMNTDSISLSDYYVLDVPLKSGSEWQSDAITIATEAIDKILLLDSNSEILIVGHSIGGVAARQITHPSVVAVCGISVPDNALTLPSSDWQEALHVLNSLGLESQIVMGVSQ